MYGLPLESVGRGICERRQICPTREVVGGGSMPPPVARAGGKRLQPQHDATLKFVQILWASQIR